MFLFFFCSQFSYFIVFNLKCACDLVFLKLVWILLRPPSSFTCISVSNNTLCVASELFLRFVFFVFFVLFEIPVAFGGSRSFELASIFVSRAKTT